VQRLDHLLWQLTTQRTARANAAEAAATLHRRRREQEEVDAYLLAAFDRPSRRSASPETLHGDRRPT
jgi:hypothetical protein